MKFSQNYKPDGVFSTIMHLYIYQTAILCTLVSQDLINPRENQMFPQSLNQLDGVLRV